MTLQHLMNPLELPEPPLQLVERLSGLTAQPTETIYPFRLMLALVEALENTVSAYLQIQPIAEQFWESIQQIGQGVPYEGNLDDLPEKVDSGLPLLIQSMRSNGHRLSELASSLSDLFASPDAHAVASANLIRRIHVIEEQVEQLTERQQALAENYEKHKDEWLADLLIQISRQRELTVAEKLRLSDAVELALPVQTMPSVRREDWYGVDGR